LTVSENNTGLITGAKGILLLSCFLVLLACTLFECGFALLGLMGIPEHPPVSVTALYWSLAPFAIAALVYLKWPVVTIIAGWLFLLLSSYVAFYHFNEEHDLTWYLYQHSLELGYVAASHIGYFAALKNRNKQTRMHSLAN
jgi:hypothetical protein